MQKAVCDTELAFDHSFVFIHQVLHATDSLFRLQVGIGDGFGDDILNTYLSKEHKENVNNYLVLYSLTT
jgi:hypothetical protein